MTNLLHALELNARITGLYLVAQSANTSLSENKRTVVVFFVFLNMVETLKCDVKCFYFNYQLTVSQYVIMHMNVYFYMYSTQYKG